MITKDGKVDNVNNQTNIFPSVSIDVAKIAENISKAVLEGIKNKISIGNNQEEMSEEEKVIVSNSLKKIADIMSTTTSSNKQSNFDRKTMNTKTTKKDISKTIDILKNLE